MSGITVLYKERAAKELMYITNSNHMKKSLFLFFTLLFFISCGKEDDINPGENQKPGEGTYTAEKVFEETGCKPTEIEKILSLTLFTDSDGTKYLYGSKKKEEIESFWVAQFSSSGDQIWEIVKKDGNSESLAHNLQRANAEKLVVAYMTKEGFELKNGNPMFIDKEGKAETFHVDDNFFFSNVRFLSNYIFFYIDKKELYKYPHTTNLRTAQFDEDKNLVNLEENILLPNEYATMVDKDFYLILADSYIAKKHLNSTKTDQNWNFSFNLPVHESYEAKVSLDEDTLTLGYTLTYGTGEQELFTYKRSYETGKLFDEDDPDSPSKYVYLELGKEYIAPNNMSVTVHSIDIENPGKGTLYYTISYTESNKTADGMIQQCGFETFLPDYSLSDYQSGSFGKLNPGESDSKTYTFKALNNQPIYFFHYNHQDGHSSVPALRTSLKWKAPQLVLPAPVAKKQISLPGYSFH